MDADSKLSSGLFPENCFPARDSASPGHQRKSALISVDQRFSFGVRVKLSREGREGNEVGKGVFPLQASRSSRDSRFGFDPNCEWESADGADVRR